MSNNGPAITIIGNAVGDAELRFTPSGVAVANFTVAQTPRHFDKNRNEWVDDDPTFIRCTVWKEAAENAAETITKGMRLVVVGTLKVRQYETRDGGKGTSVECDVEDVGPSLRWASASVTKTGRSNQPPRQAAADPWARDEAPPF